MSVVLEMCGYADQNFGKLLQPKCVQGNKNKLRSLKRGAKLLSTLKSEDSRGTKKLDMRNTNDLEKIRGLEVFWCREASTKRQVRGGKTKKLRRKQEKQPKD